MFGYNNPLISFLKAIDPSQYVHGLFRARRSDLSSELPISTQSELVPTIKLPSVPSPHTPVLATDRHPTEEQLLAARDLIHTIVIQPQYRFAHGVTLDRHPHNGAPCIAVQVHSNELPDPDGLKEILTRQIAPIALVFLNDRDLSTPSLSRAMSNEAATPIPPPKEPTCVARNLRSDTINALSKLHPGSFIGIKLSQFVGPFDSSSLARQQVDAVIEGGGWGRIVKLGANPRTIIFHTFNRYASQELPTSENCEHHKGPWIPISVPTKPITEEYRINLEQMLNAVTPGLSPKVILKSHGHITIKFRHLFFPNPDGLKAQIESLTGHMVSIDSAQRPSGETLFFRRPFPYDRSTIRELAQEYPTGFVYICGDQMIGPLASETLARVWSLVMFPYERWGEIVKLSEADTSQLRPGKLHSNLFDLDPDDLNSPDGQDSMAPL